jgi:hypothetical protein
MLEGAGGGIPELDGSIIRAGCQKLVVLREGNWPNRIRMALQGLQFWTPIFVHHWAFK